MPTRGVFTTSQMAEAARRRRPRTIFDILRGGLANTLVHLGCSEPVEMDHSFLWSPRTGGAMLSSGQEEDR